MSDKKENSKKSWVTCEHANESPSICPCPADCICRDKGNMCENQFMNFSPFRENIPSKKKMKDFYLDCTNSKAVKNLEEAINNKKNCNCGCSNVKGISHEQYKKNLADSFSQIKDTGGQQPIVATYMVSDDFLKPYKPYDWLSYNYTTTETSQPEQPLEPMQKVVITFKDGEERTGFFICDVSVAKCFIVSELTSNPPGWYVEKNKVKVFVK